MCRTGGYELIKKCNDFIHSVFNILFVGILVFYHCCYKEQKKVWDKIKKNKSALFENRTQTAIIMQIKIIIRVKHGCNFIYLFFTSNKQFYFIKFAFLSLFLFDKQNNNWLLKGSCTFIPRLAVTPAASLVLFMKGLGQKFNYHCKRSRCCKTWEPLGMEDMSWS